MTFDLYLGQVKGQRKICYQKIFSPGSQVSWYEWILAISSWDFTIRTFICPFFSTFSVIIPWQHDMSGHRSGYELLGPWPMCPASFIEISWKLVPYFSHCLLRQEEEDGRIIIVYVKPGKNKIPSPWNQGRTRYPLLGDGITRAYWARGPVGDPIPMLLGLRTGNWVKENWAKGRIPIRDASLTCIDNYW